MADVSTNFQTNLSTALSPSSADGVQLSRAELQGLRDTIRGAGAGVAGVLAGHLRAAIDNGVELPRATRTQLEGLHGLAMEQNGRNAALGSVTTPTAELAKATGALAAGGVCAKVGLAASVPLTPAGGVGVGALCAAGYYALTTGLQHVSARVR